MADTHYYTKGTFEGEEVFFGPTTSNDAGALSDRKQRVSKAVGKAETVWVTNTKGIDMCTPLGLETARFLVNREGRKFRYALEEEIPFVPEQKIYPYDPEKKINAQERANVEMTGNDVAEMVAQGIDPLEGTVSYVEMRRIAKENGIGTFKMKKLELSKLLKEKKLIE